LKLKVEISFAVLNIGKYTIQYNYHSVDPELVPIVENLKKWDLNRAIAISRRSLFEGGCLAVTINLIVYLLLFDPDSFQEPRRRLNESKKSVMGLIL
jgi:hypothetical protein